MIWAELKEKPRNHSRFDWHQTCGAHGADEKQQPWNDTMPVVDAVLDNPVMDIQQDSAARSEFGGGGGGTIEASRTISSGGLMRRERKINL